MELNRSNKLLVPHLSKEQTDLRFELFDWLKTKGLSVEEAVELLNLTSNEIEKTARKQLL